MKNLEQDTIKNLIKILNDYETTDKVMIAEKEQLLKDLNEALILPVVVRQSEQLKEKEIPTFGEFEKTFTKRTFENETFYETKQGLKEIEDISFMYDKYLESL